MDNTEALVRFCHHDTAIEIRCRSPHHEPGGCVSHLASLENLLRDVLLRVIPGLIIEREILSYQDLRQSKAEFWHFSDCHFLD